MLLDVDLPAQEVHGLDGEPKDLARTKSGPRPEDDQGLQVRGRGRRQRLHLLRGQRDDLVLHDLSAMFRQGVSAMSRSSTAARKIVLTRE
ncbi:MAG: hypothetical protein M3N57_01720 [Actinomycetota bacterium]|nr:hypothetical protein [Actinomycetota bacterium]